MCSENSFCMVAYHPGWVIETFKAGLTLAHSVSCFTDSTLWAWNLLIGPGRLQAGR